MAAAYHSPCKTLLLLTLFLFVLCFLTATAQARNLRYVGENSHNNNNNNGGDGDEKSSSSTQKNTEINFPPTKQEAENNKVTVHDSEELVTLDYTPARKKPPIHN